jgi:hypothetical protein
LLSPIVTPRGTPVAKERGWRTVLGQIDAGPVEEKIVTEEVARERDLGDVATSTAGLLGSLEEECNVADQIAVTGMVEVLPGGGRS